MICVFDRKNCNAVVAIGATMESINAADYLITETQFHDGVGRFGICSVNHELEGYIMEAFNKNGTYYLEDRV